MNRSAVLFSIFLSVGIAGFVTSSIGEQENSQQNMHWEPSKLPDRSLEVNAVALLQDSSRWEVVDQSIQRSQKTGDFSKDYRLVAITLKGVEAHVHLQEVFSENDVPNSVSRVAVGDQLPNGWVITEIEPAAVVAKRENEVQRVELFESI